MIRAIGSRDWAESHSAGPDRSELDYVIVRPLSTVEYTSVYSGLTNLIHDHCSYTLFTLSSVSSKLSACLFHAWKVSSRGDVSTQA